VLIVNGIADRLCPQIAAYPAVTQCPFRAEEVDELLNALQGFLVCVRRMIDPGETAKAARCRLSVRRGG
jgi:hypothetical protein